MLTVNAKLRKHFNAILLIKSCEKYRDVQKVHERSEKFFLKGPSGNIQECLWTFAENREIVLNNCECIFEWGTCMKVKDKALFLYLNGLNSTMK